jgi:hypothetical protein
VVGINLSNRGAHRVNARGGSALTSAVGGAGFSDNGSVGAQIYNGSWLYANVQMLVGEDVSWEKYDTNVNVFFWPWRKNQKDLSFELSYTDLKDARATARRNPLNQANTFQDGKSANLRTALTIADAGSHTFDSEVTVGWGKEDYDSSGGDVQWTGMNVSPGFRYYYNRTFGVQARFNLPYLKYEQLMHNVTYTYTNRTTVDVELHYAMAANVLWSLNMTQAGGGLYCEDCPDMAATTKPLTGRSVFGVLELNY